MLQENTRVRINSHREGVKKHWNGLTGTITGHHFALMALPDFRDKNKIVYHIEFDKPKDGQTGVGLREFELEVLND